MDVTIDRNVFSPPGAVVADVTDSARNAGPRPRQVSWAVAIIALSSVLGFVGLDVSRRTETITATLVIVQVVVLTLFGILLNKLWIGRNWARILITVSVCWGVIVMAGTIGLQMRLPSKYSYVTIIQAVLQAGSVCLLFTRPARRWFAKT